MSKQKKFEPDLSNPDEAMYSGYMRGRQDMLKEILACLKDRAEASYIKSKFSGGRRG